MTSYWTKIAIGAACIFGVGMTGISLAKKGIHELKTAAMGPVQEALTRLPGDLLRFRLEGRRVGRIQEVQVSNDGDWNDKSVQMKVALDREVEGLADCLLTNDNWDRPGRSDARFRCADQDEIDDENLVAVGTVQFEPGSISRPLYAASQDLRKIRRSDIRGLKATLSAPDDKSVTGQAEYDLNDRHGGRQKGTVRLDASDGRALIEIKDDNGQEIFRLRADDRGVSINAKDKRGNALMRLLAGESGVDIKVNAEKDPSN